MATLNLRKGISKLKPQVRRDLFVRNLPFKITSEELYDIFGKYGAVRQIRIGTGRGTSGQAYVVYEDIYDAMNAVNHLSGFNVAGRYLIVRYNDKVKVQKKVDLKKREDEIARMQDKYGVGAVGGGA